LIKGERKKKKMQLDFNWEPEPYEGCDDPREIEEECSECGGSVWESPYEECGKCPGETVEVEVAKQCI